MIGGRIGNPIADVYGDISDSGFPFAILGGNLAAHYRADIGVTVDTGVSQWSDQSGRGNHVLQGTGGAQPTLVANVLNGRPVLRFAAASSQFLRVADATTGIEVGGLAYALVVGRQTVVGGNRAFLSVDNADVANRAFCIFAPAATTIRSRHILRVTSVINADTTLADNTFARVESWADAGAVYVRNGATEVSTAAVGNTGYAFPGTFIHVGCLPGTGFLTGDIAEVIIANSIPSAAQLSSLREYTLAVWGV